MNIILVAPKLVLGSPILDYAYFNFYLPLLKLGHDVSFFDTSKLGSTELKSEIKLRKPDMLFCVMTGDMNAFPKEPWDVIEDETRKGNILTFNWFCDDSWRYESFSKTTCKLFHWCSTPEKKFVQKYQEDGYTNIVYATWHCNTELYSFNNTATKQNDILFIGGLHGDRLDYLKKLDGRVLVPNRKVFFEEMIYLMSSSKITLNFTKDSSRKQTQMKARIFEVAATNSCLLTEDTEDLTNNFADNEIIKFKDSEEMVEKIDWILGNSDEVKTIKANHLNRVIKDHDSTVRLNNLLETLFQ